MYEVIYKKSGKEERIYPQDLFAYQQVMRLIEEGSPVYQLVSSEPCRNYKAYKAGSELFEAYILKTCNEPSLQYVSEEMEQEAIEKVIDAPFEYDRDLSYFILCEYDSFKEANDFYREVTA